MLTDHPGPTNQGEIMKTLNCPKGHGAKELKRVRNEITFKCVDLAVDADSFICPTCGLKAGTSETTGALQQKIADAYRAKKGLLTGDEIKQLRKAHHLTQRQLAEMMNIGIAIIKRWKNWGCPE